MKILVISDSHSTSLTSLNFKQYDAIIHCGDYGKSLASLQASNVHYVKGNCDSTGDEYLSLSLFGKRILITHGHQENVKFGIDRLIYRALEYQAEVCFYGHTHQQSLFKEENILFINPGSYPNSYILITEDKIQLFSGKNINEISYRW